MNFMLTPPSLEHRALVKIATTLWSQGYVREWMPKPFTLLEYRWQEIEEIIFERASKLPLPVIIKEQLLDIIRPVGLQVLAWIEFHINVKQCTTKLPDALIWTPHGTVDNKRTAEVLVRDKSLDVKKRYILACLYCLVDDVSDLQGKVSYKKNEKFDHYLFSFWSSYLETAEFEVKRNITVRLFYYSTLNGLETATRYFYSKLHPEDIDDIKMKTIKDIANCMLSGTYMNKKSFVRYGDVLIFLLSTMTVEQQEEVLHKYTYSFLKYFLFWPRHSQFLEMAKERWNLLPKKSYNTLLYDIVENMSCKRNYLRDIFAEFWQQAPETYKRFVINHDDLGQLLLQLYKKEDEKNVRLILKDLNISSRENLIYNKAGRDICKYLVSVMKWNEVKYLIQECLPTAEEVTVFKNQCLKSETNINENNWKTFLELLENQIVEYKKSNRMDDSNKSRKRRFQKNFWK